MNKYIKLTAFTAVAALLMLEPAFAANAANAGGKAKENFIALVTGNTGLFVGLALAVWGLWMWLVSQKTFGLIMIVGGVILTAVPSLFDSVSGWVKDATGFDTKTSGATNSTQSNPNKDKPGYGLSYN